MSAGEKHRLLAIAEATSGITGTALFREMAVQLAAALHMDFAFVGELDEVQQTVQTLAFCADGKIVDNLTYTLRDTPCENVIHQRQFCAYPDHIQQQFPHDRVLAEMGIESYLGAPLFDGAGRAIGLLSLMSRRPMSDHRQAEGLLRLSAARAAAELGRLRIEETLRESEERFRATFNQAAVGIAHVSPDGRFLRLNQKFCDIAGHPCDELLERTFQDITHPDDLNADLEYVRQVLAGEIQTYSMEKRYFRKDGSVVWVNLTVSLVRDGAGGPKYFISVIEDITARKATEAGMRELSSAVEQIADSVVITDRDGVIQYVNPAYETTTGYTRADAIGRKPGFLKSGRHDKEFYERLWSTILRGEVFRGRFINRKKDGSLYHEEKTITPLKDDRGNVTHFVSTGKDITERVLAEEALARSTAEWTYAMDFLSDAIYLIGLDDKLVRANQAFYRLTGLTPENAIGRDITTLMHPQGEATLCRVCQARLARRDCHLIMEPRDPDNPTGHPIEVSLRVIRDTGGIPTGVLMVVRDLTRQREAEQALRDSEASLANAQRIAHLGNWDWNVATGQLRWSDEIYRIFGLTPQQFAATYEAFLDAVHPDDRRAVTDAVHRALHENRPYRIDHRIVRPDGSVRILHEQAEVTFDDTGRAVRMVGTVQDVTEYRETQERLSHLAYFDSLTGLPNRQQLHDHMTWAMKEATGRERLMAVLFLDLDRFKNINDTLGHDTGDALLKEVAARLRASLRPGDVIARLGGDEFTIVLANVAHVDDVTRVTQKLLDQFLPPFRIGGRDLFITPSIGITLYPLDDNSPENLLKNADIAMYHAKELGRNNFQFYTAELNLRAARRLELETGLRRALERNEFVLYYQPLVDMQRGRITGMEALLRWRHPEFGLIPPMEFIPLAEETGLIVPIGEWVLRAACEQIMAWHATGFPPMHVAVNLSSVQLRQKNFADTVKRILKDTGLDPRYLDLELTESLLMQDMEAAETILKELKDHGVLFSLDDFGTGYSSLSYLKRFPIDFLKIDRSFVRDITHDRYGAGIVRAIIVMAHTLDIKVIAEGVETAEHLRFLREQGCDISQGYYCSEPLDTETFTDLLRDWNRLRQGKCSIGQAAGKPRKNRKKINSPRRP